MCLGSSGNFKELERDVGLSQRNGYPEPLKMYRKKFQ